jgi:hypothetical protein
VASSSNLDFSTFLENRRFQSEVNKKRGDPYINTEIIAVKVYRSKNVSFISGVYWVSHEHGTIVERPYIFV